MSDETPDMTPEPLPEGAAGSGLDVGRVLADGWGAFRSRLKDFLVVSIGVGIMYGIILGVLLLVVVGSSATNKDGQPSGAFLGVALGGLVVTMIVLAVVAVFVAAIETRLALAAVDGDDSILGHLGREALGRIGPFFGWGIVSWLLVMVGLLLCLLPGIAIAFFLAFLPFIVIEGRLRGNPIKESFEAVKERAGELILIYLVLVGISMLANFLTFFVQAVPIIGPILQGIVAFLVSGFALCTYAAVYRSTTLGALATSEPQVPMAPPLPESDEDE